MCHHVLRETKGLFAPHRPVQPQARECSFLTPRLVGQKLGSRRAPLEEGALESLAGSVLENSRGEDTRKRAGRSVLNCTASVTHTAYRHHDVSESHHLAVVRQPALT
jgi:hypothetical protein